MNDESNANDPHEHDATTPETGGPILPNLTDEEQAAIAEDADTPPQAEPLSGVTDEETALVDRQQAILERTLASRFTINEDTDDVEPVEEEPVEDFDEADLEDEDSDEEVEVTTFSAPLAGGAELLPDANDHASRTYPVEAPQKTIDPSQRRRGTALPGATPYKPQAEVNARSAPKGDHRYVVRYQRRKEQGTDRVRTLSDPEGLFETRAEAQDVADRIKKQRVRLKDGRPTKLPKYVNVRVEKVELPDRILTWDKWAQLRLDIRKLCLRRGLALSGGDRTPERNEQVGGVRNSSHLTTRKDRWADDYIAGNNYALMEKVAAEIRAKFGKHGRLEILIHDAGSGVHLHVGGPTDGNN